MGFLAIALIPLALSPAAHSFAPRSPHAFVPKTRSGAKPILFALPDKFTTSVDGNILVPERRRLKLIIFNGGTDPKDQDWIYKGDNKEKKNVLWEMKLRNAKGIPDDEMDEYNEMWEGGGNTINDARRVIHNNEIHIAVCGNAGDALAMYEFKSKKCVFWSKTVNKKPHDVEYIPTKGRGFLAVADSNDGDATIDLYDLRKSKNAYVKGASVSHPGVHSVIWDAGIERLWSWGRGNIGLRKYELRFNKKGKPRLKLENTYEVDLKEDDQIELGVGETLASAVPHRVMCLFEQLFLPSKTYMYFDPSDPQYICMRQVTAPAQ